MTDTKGFFKSATGVAVSAGVLFLTIFVAAYAWSKGSKTAAK